MKIFEILSKRFEKSKVENLSLAGNMIAWRAYPVNIETLIALIYDFLSKTEKIRSTDLLLMETDDEIGERIGKCIRGELAWI